MTDLVTFVFSVGGLIAFLLTGVSWVSARPDSRRARRWLLFVALCYALSTIYVISFGVGRLLVAGFRPLTLADVPPGPIAIAVLGSGGYTVRDWDDREYSTTDAIGASRALEALRVYRIANPAWVISLGGNRRANDLMQPTGLSIKDLLLQLGVPADRVVTSTIPRNTHEEAVIVASMLPTLKVQHLVVVTSEFHMRRSMGAFRAAGVRAIPAIVREPFPRRSWREWIVPDQDGLWMSGLLAHEILGIGYYATRGWYRF